MTTDSIPRDWALLAVMTDVLHFPDQEEAEKWAAQYNHLTVVSRVPGGPWQPGSTAAEPPRYTFLFDGEMQVGVFADYVMFWLATQYGQYALSPDVRTWSGVRFTVQVDDLGMNGEHWRKYRLTLGTETETVLVDALS